MALSFNKNNLGLTLFLNGNMYTVPADAPNYRKVLGAIKLEDEEALLASLSVAEAVSEAFESVVGNGVQVTADGVYVNGRKMHNALSTKIMEFMSEGLSFEPLVKFLKNFMENPLIKLASNPEVLVMMGKSASQADEIINEFTDDFFSFLENKNLPVTKDGNFLAYKGVQQDYYSITAGQTTLTKGIVQNRKVYNAPGQYIETERGQVDPSRRNECSYGLHVGAAEYASSFGSGGKVVIVEVNPKDVVAIPPDCSRQKMRVCAYSVVQDYKGALTRPAYVTSVEDDDDIDLYDDDYEYEDSYDDDVDEIDEITPDSIFIGDEITFQYNSHGQTNTRYLDVTEYGFDVAGNLDRLIGVLLSPEDEAGEYRSFKVDKMENVQYN